MPTLSPAQIAYQKEHIGDDRRIGIAVSNAVCYGLAFFAVVLRIYSRRLARIPFGADDWWIWGAFVRFPCSCQSPHKDQDC